MKVDQRLFNLGGCGAGNSGALYNQELDTIFLEHQVSGSLGECMLLQCPCCAVRRERNTSYETGDSHKGKSVWPPVLI